MELKFLVEEVQLCISTFGERFSLFFNINYKMLDDDDEPEEDHDDDEENMAIYNLKSERSDDFHGSITTPKQILPG